MLIRDILTYLPLAVAAFLCLVMVSLMLKNCGRNPFVDLISALRRQPGPAKLFLVCFVGALIAYGSTKAPTNAPPRSMSAPRRSRVVIRTEPWYTGTNEIWCFDCPAWGAEVVPWTCRGAFEDWTSCGELGVLVANGRVISDGAVYDVYDSPLAVVPAAAAADAVSRVWYGRAPWGSDVYTWQNARVDRDATNVVSVQLERMYNGDTIYRYANVPDVTSRAFLAPRDVDADSDGDGIPDSSDADLMDPDSDADGIVDGMTRSEYERHPLWLTNGGDGEPLVVRLNAPVVPPAKAVLEFGTLRILLTTNAVYRFCLQEGVRYDVKLVTNGLQPVDLSTERGDD